MKLGFFTANFTEKPLEDVIRLIAPYGYEALEIPAYEGNGQLETAEILKGNNAANLKKLVRDSGMTIEALSNHSDSFLIMGTLPEKIPILFLKELRKKRSNTEQKV